MKQFVIASKNEGKIKEIKNALHGLNLELLSLADFPDIPDIEEDGRTFEENAIKKAKTVFEHTKITTFADDSGLEVEHLRNAPGVYSKRFSGDNSTDELNNEKLLKELEGLDIDERRARFRCVISIYNPFINELSFEGKCEGYIIDEPKGTNGFGYDPLFVPEGYHKTFAELDLVTKNKISHRGRALAHLRTYLEKYVS
ncbi:MAG: XTP/dITP diphosphatase [Ignavibacteriae bacterium]|nr:MAG: XTP/dITP diphosphatase [Ignavibacteriota bacterium]